MKTGASVAAGAVPKDTLRLLYYAVAGWFIVSYIQPQTIVPALGVIRPGLISTVVVLVCWIKTHDRRAFREPFAIMHLLLLLVLALGIFTAVNTFWLFTYFQVMAIHWIVFYLAMPLLMEREDYRFKLFLLFAVAFGFIGVWVMTHGGHGQGSFLGDENDAAVALSTGFCLCFPLRTLFPTRFQRVICNLALLLCAGGVVASLSRGGFLGLVTGMFAVALFSGKLIKTLVTLAVLSVLALPLVPSGYWKEMNTMNDPNDSTRVQRLYMWRIGISMWAGNPVIGVGAGNYPYRVQDYETTKFVQKANIFNRSFGGRPAHSTYFTLLPELGSAGALIFLLMVARILRQGFRLARSPPGVSPSVVALGRGIAAGVLAFMMSGAFVTALYYPHFWLLCGLGTSMAYIAAQKRVEPNGEPAAAGPAVVTAGRGAVPRKTY